MKRSKFKQKLVDIIDQAPDKAIVELFSNILHPPGSRLSAMHEKLRDDVKMFIEEGGAVRTEENRACDIDFFCDSFFTYSGKRLTNGEMSCALAKLGYHLETVHNPPIAKKDKGYEKAFIIGLVIKFYPRRWVEIDQDGVIVSREPLYDTEVDRRQHKQRALDKLCIKCKESGHKPNWAKVQYMHAFGEWPRRYLGARCYPGVMFPKFFREYEKAFEGDTGLHTKKACLRCNSIG